MAYSLVSASSPKTLLAAIITFATAQGWTIDYDHANGVGSVVGGQIALSSGNCHIAIGEQTAVQNPIVVTGPANDGRLYMALASAINPALIQFWNHTGSNVTTAADTDRNIINDVWGPMDEVHFFGNEDYIICMVKCSANRWTMFGFGNLNMKGLPDGAPGFCFSNYQEWWNIATSGDHINAALYLASYFICNTTISNAINVFIPNGVLDTSFGFAAGNVIATGRNSANHILAMIFGASHPEAGETDNSAGSFALDHLLYTRPQTTTGGVALMALPVFYQDTALNLMSFLGEFPIVRACRMTNLAPGAEITYGSDIYKVFPWKQKGTAEEGGYGGTYNDQPNSFDLGWAILKD
jgi:hypothetical protein